MITNLKYIFLKISNPFIETLTLLTEMYIYIGNYYYYLIYVLHSAKLKSQSSTNHTWYQE